ncbi:hypothetical protein MMC22_007613 [Lobaria immixta]|nr:hypothetical protein [Lobaria immixta]
MRSKSSKGLLDKHTQGKQRTRLTPQNRSAMEHKEVRQGRNVKNPAPQAGIRIQDRIFDPISPQDPIFDQIIPAPPEPQASTLFADHSQYHLDEGHETRDEWFPLATCWDGNPEYLSPGESAATFSDLVSPLDPGISRVSELQESAVADVVYTDATIAQSQSESTSKRSSHSPPGDTTARIQSLTHQNPLSQLDLSKDEPHGAGPRSYNPGPPRPSSGARKKHSARDSTTRSTAPFNCPNCQKRFSRRCERNKHVKTHTRTFRCEIPDCPSSGFYRLRDLNRHVSSCHKNVGQDTKFYCTIQDCAYATKGFPRKDNCKRHIREQHQGQSRDNPDQ